MINIKNNSEEITTFPDVNVLLVEDDYSNQKLMELQLSKYQINLKIVDNGKKAIEDL